jgi:class 3 adenylate cyclase
MWGVPSFSHKGNGVLALKCGALIRHEGAEAGHACSIGVATGLVYCSSIGSSIRRDYVGIGDKVNLAARLMCKAKGRILLDDGTTAILPEEVRRLLERGESLHLKGIEGAYIPHVYTAGGIPEVQEELNVFHQPAPNFSIYP